MANSEIETFLIENPELADKLFCRGFFLTNAAVYAQCPSILSQWTIHQIGDVFLYVHPKQTVYMKNGLCLIGHAYDPLMMQSDETTILQSLDESNDFYEALSRLTGVFTIARITETMVEIVGDASGMQTTFYMVRENNYYVSSHAMLLAELLNLSWDSYVEELTRYRFFSLLGNTLPGDLSQFSEVKRLTPNHFVILSGNGISATRFYTPHKLVLSREEIVTQLSELLHRNLRLISEKWTKPAISLTGGCDSKTTLACANGLYDRFSYFSYSSSEAEELDAQAAASICSTLGLQHTLYRIPMQNDQIQNYTETAKVLRWNSGDIQNGNPNDIRKRAFFADTEDFDVEVKSWVSEIGRAYYSKRFNGRTDFGEAPTPRACTTLYKFFLHNRNLVRKTDNVFSDYLEHYFQQDKAYPITWQDQFFWEFRVPSWNGLVITGEHKYSFDITIPYNNRRILELFLSATTEECLNDTIYTAIRERMNPQIDKTGIAVQNLKHTARRAVLEDLYYRIQSRILL